MFKEDHPSRTQKKLRCNVTIAGDSILDKPSLIFASSSTFDNEGGSVAPPPGPKGRGNTEACGSRGC